MSRRQALVERAEMLQRTLRETPLIKLDEPGMNLFAKLEYCNPVGSIKDRPALFILRRAIERGELDEETTVIESSSGNFALSLAVYCRMLRVRCVPVIDPNISRLNEGLLRSVCPVVVKVDQPDEAGGYLKTRLARVRELCSSHGRAYWPNQYGNPDGMLAHYHTSGTEISRALSHLDFVFVGVSSAGTIAGLSVRLKERFPGVRVVAVDAEGSVIFGGKPQKRTIPGLGSSIVPELLASAQIDDTVIVPEREAAASCRELLERHGIFAGGSTGAVYAAVKRYFGQPSGHAKPTVLFLCADRGSAYVETVYDDGWVSRLEEAR